MAASRSAMAVDCPAIGVPPDIEIFVGGGLGVELPEEGFDLALGLPSASATKNPAEEACCFGAGFASCRLAAVTSLSVLCVGGVPEREGWLLLGALGRFPKYSRSLSFLLYAIPDGPA